MKRIMKTMFGIIVCFMVIGFMPEMSVKAASAQDFTYVLDASAGTAIITGYEGTERDLVIPSELAVRGAAYKVEDVADRAFYNNDIIETISFEDGIKTIGSEAFYDCDLLNTVKMCDSIESIGEYAFYSCDNMEELKLSDSLPIIANYSFYECISLKTITIPKNVVEIDAWAFGGCVALSDVQFEAGSLLSYIRISAFKNCALKYVEFPPNPILLEAAVFSGNPIEKVIFSDDCKIITSHSLTDIIDSDNPKVIVMKGVVESSVTFYPLFGENTEIYGISGTDSQTIATEYGYSFFPINAPANLKAEKRDTSVKLTWSSVSPVAQYKVFRSAQMNGIYEEIGITAGTEFIDKNIEKDKIWYYKICVTYTDCFDETVDGIYSQVEVKKLPRFNDISEGEYYYIPVLWAVEESITSGYTENRFAPEMPCTRGQVVTFLWRVMGQPEPMVKEYSFKDIKQGEYYYNAVLWAVEEGITNGINETMFAPEQTVTRGQFVTFLYRMMDAKDRMIFNPFEDVPEDVYYYNPVLWAYDNQITTGLTYSLFGPEQYCTRGQVVSFLYRAFNEEYLAKINTPASNAELSSLVGKDVVWSNFGYNNEYEEHMQSLMKPWVWRLTDEHSFYPGTTKIRISEIDRNRRLYFVLIYDDMNTGHYAGFNVNLNTDAVIFSPYDSDVILK